MSLMLMRHLDLSTWLMQSTPESSPVQPSSKQGLQDPGAFYVQVPSSESPPSGSREERTFRECTLPLNYLGPQVVPITCPYISLARTSQNQGAEGTESGLIPRDHCKVLDKQKKQMLVSPGHLCSKAHIR